MANTRTKAKSAAQLLGSRGGLARAKNLSAQQLSTIGRKAAAARHRKRAKSRTDATS